MRIWSNCRPSSKQSPACRVKGFAADAAGVTSVLFAICFTVVLAVAAIAVDYGRGFLERHRHEAALDAGTLAAADKTETDDVEATVASYLKANTAKGTEGKLEDVTINESGEMTTTAATNMRTSLLNGLGISSLDITSTSRVARFSGTIEIALVLDNSSDLTGAPLEDLRTAAGRLVAITPCAICVAPQMWSR